MFLTVRKARDRSRNTILYIIIHYDLLQFMIICILFVLSFKKYLN